MPTAVNDKSILNIENYNKSVPYISNMTKDYTMESIIIACKSRLTIFILKNIFLFFKSTVHYLFSNILDG